MAIGWKLVEVDGAPRMPSVVLATDSGDLVVGAAAERQLALMPDRAERTPKRRIGDATMLLGSRAVRPVEAVAAIFRAVANEAVRRQGGVAPASLRLTHPVRWGSVRLAVLAEAAELAGLPAPSFVAEPVAAAVHFADERIVDGAHVAVYDLGGGTLDTAVLRRVGRGFEVVGPPGGDERLGGETFDDRLWEHLGTRLAERQPEAWEELRFSTERQWRKAGHDFRTEVRRAKEALSSNADYTIYLGAPVDLELLVTRDELEELIRADVERTVGELLATVDRARLGIDDLAAVNLVGGSSRIPLITRMVADRTGRLPDTWGDPKAAVVLGAATVAPDAIRTLDPGRRSRRTAAPLAKIDGYEVLGELGRGGMGVVYLARQPSLGRLVAVKTLPSLDPSLTARLEREANVLAELQHPHVATVVDVGLQDAATFVVMPFFPGGTLTQVLDARGRLTPGQAAGVLAAVAEALAATHAKGFLHRDVKPSNILLSAEGQPYLADFGLAFPMLDGSRLTSSRSVLGTVPYTAPEIIADEPPQPASDVYALGVTGYQLLTGSLPYAGSNVIAVIDAIRRASAPPLHEAAPDAPERLRELIAAAMAPAAADRPSDLRAFAAELRRAVPVEDVVPAPPAEWASLATTPLAAPPEAGSSPAAVATADDASTAVTTPSPAPARTRRRRRSEPTVTAMATTSPAPPVAVTAPSETTRPKRTTRVLAIAAAIAVVAAATGFGLSRRGGSDDERRDIDLAASASDTTTSTDTTAPPTTEDTTPVTEAPPVTDPPAASPPDSAQVAASTGSRTATKPAGASAPANTNTNTGASATPVAEAPAETPQSTETAAPAAETETPTTPGGTEPTPTDTPPPTDTYPNASEQLVLSKIPSYVKGTNGQSCRRGVTGELVPGAIANVRCSIGGTSDDTPYGAEFVQYSLFPSNTSLNDYYGARQSAAAGITAGKTCSDSWYGESSYGNPTVGRLLCYWQNGQQWYEWRYDPTPIYAFLMGTDSQLAWESWRVAGPYS